MIIITKDNFDKEVLQSPVPVLVDFYADWCGPCKAQAPILEELEPQYDGKVTFAKVDVDAEPEIAMNHRVMSIPTLIIFRDGAALERNVGLASEEELCELLDGIIS